MAKTYKSNKYKVKEKLHWFEIFSSRAIKIAGSSSAFITACILILVWIVTGPLFHYSNVWQLAINTGTTIVTFLMVFLIQKTQNKDALAIQIKLNELVAANIHASNRIVSIEDLSEAELERLNEYYTRLAELTKKEKKHQTSHSIEDIERLKDEKQKVNRKIDNIQNRAS
jgi:low affinity Fe/Cu permease